MLIPIINPYYNVGVNAQSVNQEYKYLYDATGAYDAIGNVGGYGTPNPAYTDVIKSVITSQLISGSTVGTVDIDSGTTPTAIQMATPNGGYYWSLSSIDTGQSTSVEALTDGVYKIYYYVFVEDYGNAGIDVDFVNGSSTITLSGNIPPTWTDVTAITDSDGNLYQIVSGSWNGTDEFTLGSPYTGTTKTDLGCFTGYWAVNYVSCVNGLTTCVEGYFVDIANSCCNGCKEQDIKLASKGFTLLNAINANIACGEYAKAQYCVEALTDLCNTNDDCNCGQ